MISLLKETIPLERAQMRVKILLKGKEARKIREKIFKICKEFEQETWENSELLLVLLLYFN